MKFEFGEVVDLKTAPVSSQKLDINRIAEIIEPSEGAVNKEDIIKKPEAVWLPAVLFTGTLFAIFSVLFHSLF